MTKPAQWPTDDASLRRKLHEDVDRMSGSGLALLGRIVQQLEIEKLAGELDIAFDDDRGRGALTLEKVQQIIEQVRAEHPYGR
jgi:hypothetical protein